MIVIVAKKSNINRVVYSNPLAIHDEQAMLSVHFL